MAQKNRLKPYDGLLEWKTGNQAEKDDNRPIGLCMSCGDRLPRRKRKYCSVECPQELRRTLSARTGLLRALNTRYATFYFTNLMVIMDILPFDLKEIFSFILQRADRASPAEDYQRMANLLGNVWWAERKRTNKKYLASQLVLGQASRNGVSVDSIKPLQTKTPAVKDTFLLQLKLGKSDLESSNLQKVIKQAYRRQAKKYHPDLGGEAKAFRKIHNAYQELIDWADSPVFVNRRGFPDKWFYDGNRNRWVQPISVR